jgi:hypothetical protein
MATPSDVDASQVAVDDSKLSPVVMQKLEVDLPQIQQWVRCLCIVNFDLLIGQTLELCVPGDTLCSEEMVNVANLAFPDSHSGVFGDASFVFRFRSQDARDPYPFYFGWTYFRQKRDATINRGYFQKSVVLITHLPVNLEPIVNLIGMCVLVSIIFTTKCVFLVHAFGLLECVF